MAHIPSFVFDSRADMTDMCMFGAQCCADKSPFNERGHRHAYTALYATLFAPLRNKPINLGEIGVAGGPSVMMWSLWFSQANFYGYDRDQNFLDHCASLETPRSTFELLTVKEEASMRAAFEKVPGGFDILIDDSSHEVEDQIRIVKTAFPYMKSGGILVVEDIFREIPEETFTKELQEVVHQCSFAAFFNTEHERRWSPGWNNDKVLVLVKA